MNLESDGCEFWDGAISQTDITKLKLAINELDQDIPRYGIRSIEKLVSGIETLANSRKYLNKAQNFIKAPVKLLSATLFDKSSDENWFVPWHQDRTIPVNNKFDKIGWSKWTEKRGTLYVEPPTDILQKMITFRIHLDDVFPKNGCLRFIPGSHKQKLHEEEKTNYISQKAVNCLRKAGDAFIMRPLLLHSSNKSKSTKPRKVIHLEYISSELPFIANLD